MVNFDEFLKPKAYSQIVLPDRQVFVCTNFSENAITNMRHFERFSNTVKSPKNSYFTNFLTL